MKRNRWIIAAVALAVACLCLALLGAAGSAWFLFTRSLAQDGGAAVAGASSTAGTAVPPATTSPTATDLATGTPAATTPASPEPGTSTPVPTGPAPSGPVTSSPVPTPTASPEPAVTPLDIPPEIRAALEADMDRVEAQVSELRGLQANEPVKRELISREQLAERLMREAEEDYAPEEALDDVRSLAAFGLVDPHFDLFNYLLDVQTEGILGFYEPDEETMYIVAEGDFGGFERLTYAHEYTHALQDQEFVFDLLIGDEACEQDSERCAAVQALYEGDATLVQLEWIGRFATRQDFNDIQDAFASFDTPVLDSGPAFYSKQLDFTYGGGYEFVIGLHDSGHDSGGWEAVNAAFQQLPVSTEQILHPEKYPADAPRLVAPVVLTDTLGSNWRQVDAGVMGELYTRLILEEQLPEELAAEAAAGWGGDAYVVSYSETTGQTVMALHVVWDTPQDAEEFARVFANYNRARFGGGGFSFSGGTCNQGEALSCLSIAGDETLWVLGPDEATVAAVFDLFPSPLGGG